ncbi:MAG TPA: S8 family serine peptidase, partial [Candidatus Eisenbacteria bacterium]|nr:S8 family serine peptidase [Candidatus Eisenbacteria bacterium]
MRVGGVRGGGVCGGGVRGGEMARRGISRIGVALVACATALAAEPPPRASADLAWVTFRDRGPEGWADSARARSEADAFLTPRALARRSKAAGAPAIDLPPPAPYVAALESAGARVRVRSRWLNAVSVDAPPAALERIRSLPFVASLAPVSTMERQAPGVTAGVAAPATAEEFNFGAGGDQLDMLHVPEAHAMGYTGAGVLIGVLDTGFELAHECFARLDVRDQRDFVFNDSNTGFDASQDAVGQSSHGTATLSAMAGYAPGKLIGAAYGASFLLAKTERTNSERPIEEDYWIAGLEWVEAMGADVATTSLSYPDWYRREERDGRTAPVTRMANLAWERGLLLVNSVGNYGPGGTTLAPPADAPGVLSVGAVDRNGRVVGFSSRGPAADGRVKPELCALGSGVRLAGAWGHDAYEFASGTSFASPLVAGLIARLLASDDSAGVEQVVQELAASAPDRGSSRRDRRSAYLVGME